jgi:outer membrane receptor protein involved in Fe transport
LRYSLARSFKTDSYGAYGQDVLRLNERLTITAGLRYEYNTPMVEANGKVATLVNLTDATERLGGLFCRQRQ